MFWAGVVACRGSPRPGRRRDACASTGGMRALMSSQAVRYALLGHDLAAARPWGWQLGQAGPGPAPLAARKDQPRDRSLACQAPRPATLRYQPTARWYRLW